MFDIVQDMMLSFPSTSSPATLNAYTDSFAVLRRMSMLLSITSLGTMSGVVTKCLLAYEAFLSWVD